MQLGQYEQDGLAVAKPKEHRWSGHNAMKQDYIAPSGSFGFRSHVVQSCLPIQVLLGSKSAVYILFCMMGILSQCASSAHKHARWVQLCPLGRLRSSLTQSLLESE
jgi:hypothetical protein